MVHLADEVLRCRRPSRNVDLGAYCLAPNEVSADCSRGICRGKRNPIRYAFNCVTDNEVVRVLFVALRSFVKSIPRALTKLYAIQLQLGCGLIRSLVPIGVSHRPCVCLGAVRRAKRWRLRRCSLGRHSPLRMVSPTPKKRGRLCPAASWAARSLTSSRRAFPICLHFRCSPLPACTY